MHLQLIKKDESKYYDLIGKKYQMDYDILQIRKKIELRIKIDELIEIEKNLTLLEELENKKEPTYNDFIESFILKRKLR